MKVPRLQPWPRDAVRRRAYVDAVFRRVAPRYDRLTSLLSFGQDERWKSSIVELLPVGTKPASILDLATGTAAFPHILRRAGHVGPIVGVDRSRAMLALAHEKCSSLADVRFVQGDLNALPVAEGSFDVILVGYGLRYLDDLKGAMRAAYQVLRPGGVFLSLDFGVPRDPWHRRLCLSYLFCFGTLWGLLLHGKLDTYWHIVESIQAYPGQDALAGALEGAGFEDIVLVERLGGISVVARARRGDGVREGTNTPRS
jgi:demethylmenaquinone methyltransferase/2-methoxy-6-polyprenyl-1,4-benzoquinol methylase